MFRKLIDKSNILLYSIPLNKYFCLKQNKSFLSFLFIIILSLPVYPQWVRTNGPEGIGISSLSNIDGTIYAGTLANGVYASTDDGINWIARNASIETLEVTSIVSKPGYIFAGTFGSGVYRSTNSGQTKRKPLKLILVL